MSLNSAQCYHITEMCTVPKIMMSLFTSGGTGGQKLSGLAQGIFDISLSVSQLPRNTLCWQRNLRPMKTSSSQKFALSVPGNCKMRYLYAARLQAHFRLTVAEAATAPRC